MASKGTILFSWQKEYTNSFDGDGTRDLMEKTFDGSYFSEGSVEKNVELFQTFTAFLPYITN